MSAGPMPYRGGGLTVLFSVAQPSEQGVTFGATGFGDTNLLGARGLDSCLHWFPSYVDHYTLVQNPDLPKKFLHGCGLPDEWIENLRGLVGNAIE